MTGRKSNPAVGIAGVIGGISVAIVAVMAIFAREQMVFAAWIIAALAAMGVGLGYYASKGL